MFPTGDLPLCSRLRPRSRSGRGTPTRPCIWELRACLNLPPSLLKRAPSLLKRARLPARDKPPHTNWPAVVRQIASLGFCLPLFVYSSANCTSFRQPTAWVLVCLCSSTPTAWVLVCSLHRSLRPTASLLKFQRLLEMGAAAVPRRCPFSLPTARVQGVSLVR
jgi:hypothetical protein